MKNQFIKWFLKLALCAAVFVVSDYFFGMSIKTIIRHSNKLNPEADKTYYLLNEVNTDVIIVGASEVEFSYRPDILMDSLGMSVYNCGKNGQRLYYQTVVVNSIIDRYSPRLIVWSVSPNCLTPHQGDIDKTSSLKPYYHDNIYCREMLQKRSWCEKYKLLSYFYLYNSEFHSYILNAVKHQSISTYKGYKQIAKTTSYPSIEEMIYSDLPDELIVAKFSETVNRLREKEIQTVFVFSPSYSYGDYNDLNSYILLKKIIDDNRFELIEKYYHYAPLMYDYYFKDKDHLTVKGVEIFTKAIAHDLKVRVY